MLNFLKKKSVIASIVILVIISFFVFRGKNALGEYESEIVSKKDLKKTVLANGTVVSGVDLNLAFKTSGIVRSLPVKVGQKVKAGQVLAQLDNKNEAAGLAQASGSLAQARASLQKVLDGVSSEEVKVAQTAADAAKVTLDNAKLALESTKAQQALLVANAKKQLLNSSFEAVPSLSNQNSTSPTITGTYNSSIEGQYIITQEGESFTVSGMEVMGSQRFHRSLPLPLPLGTRGLYVTFPSTNINTNDTWTVNIPNTLSPSYVTNLNNFNQAVDTQRNVLLNAENTVKSAESAYNQALAQVDAKKAVARPAEVALARAQVQAAQGQVAAAAAVYENTVLRAPADGTITSIDIKLGEQATALKGIVRLQNLDSLHVESNISEANIAQLQPGQKTTYTFDSFGADKMFVGVVELIDPASVIVSGVVNYKVTTSLPQVPDIRSGMTANMVILTSEKTDIIAIPSRAITTIDGKKTVKVLKNKEEKIVEEREIQTDMEDSAGQVEITSGLTEGEEIITLIKP